MTITWGISSRIVFEGPYPIENWDPPKLAAIYCIMFKPDPHNKPDTFKIIYFGETENLSDRGFYKNHHKHLCWEQQAGAVANIFIGIHRMPNSTEPERKNIENMLINEYKPVCNEQ